MRNGGPGNGRFVLDRRKFSFAQSFFLNFQELDRSSHDERENGEWTKVSIFNLFFYYTMYLYEAGSSLVEESN